MHAPNPILIAEVSSAAARPQSVQRGLWSFSYPAAGASMFSTRSTLALTVKSSRISSRARRYSGYNFFFWLSISAYAAFRSFTLGSFFRPSLSKASLAALCRAISSRWASRNFLLYPALR